MTIDKIKELGSEELAAKAKEMQEQMFRMNFQIGMGQADVLKKLRETKKDRARVLTVLSERKLNELQKKEGK